jgi:nucleotide-binding universal stress UspA family protein
MEKDSCSMWSRKSPFAVTWWDGNQKLLMYWLDLMADALRPQIPSQVIYHDLFEEAQWKLSALLPPAAHDRFRTLVVVGKAFEEIVRVANDRKIDLIMLGEHSRRGLTGLFRRSLAGLVARRVAIPVITVWNSGHVISEQLWVSESMLCGSLSEHHTGKQVGGRKSKATPKRAPLGVCRVGQAPGAWRHTCMPVYGRVLGGGGRSAVTAGRD